MVAVYFDSWLVLLPDDDGVVPIHDGQEDVFQVVVAILSLSDDFQEQIDFRAGIHYGMQVGFDCEFSIIL